MKPVALQAAATPESLQSQVLDAVVAALGGEAQNAFRCQLEPFTSDQLPADNVLPDTEDTDYADNTSVDLTFKFFIRHTAQAVNQVDIAVDARFVRAQQLILADPTLGGLVRRVIWRGRKWEFEKGALDTVACVVTYEAEFSTNRADPSLPGY